jgi:hypothetical protein
MTIERNQLIDEVVIPGKDFLGRSSIITFTPHDQPGWWWDTRYHGFVPIDHRIARYKKGRIQLAVPGEEINVWEHFGPLRLTGADGLAVRMDHNSWGPYKTAGEYELYFKGKLKSTGSTIPIVYPSVDYSNHSYNHLLSEVQIKKSDHFSLTLVSQWEDLPMYKDTIGNALYNESFKNQIFFAKTQALSHRKIPAYIAQKLFGWPHMHNVAWKKDFKSPTDASYGWWLHAVQDALGEISLASHTAIPVGSFMRIRANHKQMLDGVTYSFPL